jgi:hypothetical protein
MVFEFGNCICFCPQVGFVLRQGCWKETGAVNSRVQTFLTLILMTETDISSFQDILNFHGERIL